MFPGIAQSPPYLLIIKKNGFLARSSFYFYEVLEKNIGFERVRISVGEFFGIVKEKNSKVSFHTADVLYDLNKF